MELRGGHWAAAEFFVGLVLRSRIVVLRSRIVNRTKAIQF